jgi:hypothetical protein
MGISRGESDSAGDLKPTLGEKSRVEAVILRVMVGGYVGDGKGRHTVLLHDGEDLDNDLGGGSDHDLSLSSSFGIDDVVLRSQSYVR